MESIGKKCPRCGGKIKTYPALSRRDNKTYICSDCGQDEAMFDFWLSQNKTMTEEMKESARKQESKWLTK